jgi:hypothetical protein
MATSKNKEQQGSTILFEGTPPPMAFVPAIRSFLLKFLPPPNRATLGNKTLTYRLLGDIPDANYLHLPRVWATILSRFSDY